MDAGAAGWVQVGGIRTRYLEAGAGLPVVLLHGSGPGVSAEANWRLALPALGEAFHVLAPDLVGFGGTEVPGRIETGLDTWVGHAAGFIEALRLGPVDVVGNSMGGAVALGLAARRPDLVRRVVAMGTVGVPFPITEALDRVWGYRPSLEAMRELIRLFAYDPSFAEDEGLVRLRFEASAAPGAAERYAALFPPPRHAILLDLDKTLVKVEDRVDYSGGPGRRGSDRAHPRGRCPRRPLGPVRPGGHVAPGGPGGGPGPVAAGLGRDRAVRARGAEASGPMPGLRPFLRTHRGAAPGDRHLPRAPGDRGRAAPPRDRRRPRGGQGPRPQDQAPPRPGGGGPGPPPGETGGGGDGRGQRVGRGRRAGRRGPVHRAEARAEEARLRGR